MRNGESRSSGELRSPWQACPRDGCRCFLNLKDLYRNDRHPLHYPTNLGSASCVSSHEGIVASGVADDVGGACVDGYSCGGCRRIDGEGIIRRYRSTMILAVRCILHRFVVIRLPSQRSRSILIPYSSCRSSATLTSCARVRTPVFSNNCWSTAFT